MPASAPSDEQSEIRNFCADIGELMVWAVHVDSLLTRALVCAFQLVDSPMLKPIVSELNFAAKTGMLRGIAKPWKNKDFRKHLSDWIANVEKLNQHRNTAAHHSIAAQDGTLVLHSEQARKLFKQLKDGKPQPLATQDDVRQWARFGSEVYAQGLIVLENLEKFAAETAQTKPDGGSEYGATAVTAPARSKPR